MFDIPLPRITIRPVKQAARDRPDSAADGNRQHWSVPIRFPAQPSRGQ